MNQRETRAQRFSKPALECVRSVKSNSALADDYKPRAMSFPTMVLQAGLAQSVGFLSAKSGGDGKAKAYKRYFDDLAKVAGKTNGETLLKEALKADLSEYRLLTRDVLDAAAWLKRFCQSLIKEKSEGKGNDDGH